MHLLKQEFSKLDNVTLLPPDVIGTEQINDCVVRETKLAKIDVVFNNVGRDLYGLLESYLDDQIIQLDQNQFFRRH